MGWRGPSGDIYREATLPESGKCDCRPVGKCNCRIPEDFGFDPDTYKEGLATSKQRAAMGEPMKRLKPHFSSSQ